METKPTEFKYLFIPSENYLDRGNQMLEKNRKLDGVGPVDTRPSADLVNQLFQQKKMLCLNKQKYIYIYIYIYIYKINIKIYMQHRTFDTQKVMNIL